MKTKELIRQLQEVDPSGELECCVDNHDIFFIWRQPAYWDGCLQVLERDETKTEYNITSGKFIAHATKVSIDVLSIEDAIFNHPDMPVEYDGEYTRSRYSQDVEEWREEAIRIKQECEESNANDN